MANESVATASSGNRNPELWDPIIRLEAALSVAAEDLETAYESDDKSLMKFRSNRAASMIRIAEAIAGEMATMTGVR